MAARPELKAPVLAFLARLERGDERIPLAELAALFGAPPELLGRVAKRGDILFREGGFSNDGPELLVEAGRVELEIPSLLKGRHHAGNGTFLLEFPVAEFAPRACVSVAFFRKCFELRQMRGGAGELVLDFGSAVADRRFTF